MQIQSADRSPIYVSPRGHALTKLFYHVAQKRCFEPKTLSSSLPKMKIFSSNKQVSKVGIRSS